MSFFDQAPPEKKIDDPRVNAWNNEKIHGFESSTYKQKARQAQDAASNSSSIVDGKIVKAVHASPRDTLPANVRGFHKTDNFNQSSWDNSYPNDRGLPSSGIGGRRLGNAKQSVWSGDRPTGPTNFSKNAPSVASRSSAANTSGPPSSKGTAQSSLLKGSENKRLPLSRTPVTPSVTATSDNKASKHGTRAPPTMNSGAVAKSAKYDSNFPCSYEDCTLGFVKEKDMKKHKEQEHDWCRYCDEDFEDEDDLLCHKIESEYHICCCFCGEDFRSEAGRDRHQRQAHATQQRCKCVGCGFVFEKGSALIDHIYENKCRDRSGVIPEQLRNETIRAKRATAALYMDRAAHQPSTTSQMIAAIQPPSEKGTFLDGSSDGGGVRLEPHLLDVDVPAMNSIAAAPLLASDTSATNAGSSTVSSSGSATPTMEVNPEWPTISTVTGTGKNKEQSVIQGLEALNVSNSKGSLHRPASSVAKSTGWAAALFPDAKLTPVSGEDIAPTMVDYRRSILPGEEGKEHLIATDWDHMRYERHAFDGNYHCPFSRCSVSFMDIDDLKRHLTSGFHQGTDHQCLKCLKRFKTPAALIAHMESSSERCNIKETQQFGRMLSAVSGGFLGVSGRHTDGSIKISALTDDELKEQEREYRSLMPAADPDYPWNA